MDRQGDKRGTNLLQQAINLLLKSPSGPALLAALERDPTNAHALLATHLAAVGTPADIVNTITGGTLEYLVNIGRTESLHIHLPTAQPRTADKPAATRSRPTEHSVALAPRPNPDALRSLPELAPSVESLSQKARPSTDFLKIVATTFERVGIPTNRMGSRSQLRKLHFNNATYVVAATWFREAPSLRPLLTIQREIDSGDTQARAAIVFVSALSDAIVTSLRTDPVTVILVTKQELLHVLKLEIELPLLLKEKIYAATQHKAPFLRLDPATSAIPRSAVDARNEDSFQSLLRSCQTQVAHEIATTVGQKYLPGLYVQRQITGLLRSFFDADASSEEFRRRMSSLSIDGRRSIEPLWSPDLFSTLGSRRQFQMAIADGRIKRTPEVAATLTDCGRLTRPLFVLVDRAGAGKTNILCDLAMQQASRGPVLFISAGPLQLTDRLSIQGYIERSLSASASAPLTLDQLIERAYDARVYVCIVIDAINENPASHVVKACITQLIETDRYGVLRIAVSCRDIFWRYFEGSDWNPYVFHLSSGDLYRYSTAEWGEAIALYLAYYRLDTTLVEAAAETLSTPLLLRFFCEAYGNPAAPTPIRLGVQRRIRLNRLFHDYLEKKAANIRDRLQLTSVDPVKDYLLTMLSRMLTRQSRYLSLASLADVDPTVMRRNSLFAGILDEDIILQTTTETEGGPAQVSFVYDEFMQYLIAVSKMRRIRARFSRKHEVNRVMEHLAEAAATFEPIAGAIRYLVVMLHEEGVQLSALTIWGHSEMKRALLEALVAPGLMHVGADIAKLLIGWLPFARKAQLQEPICRMLVDLRLAADTELFAVVKATFRNTDFLEAWQAQLVDNDDARTALTYLKNLAIDDVTPVAVEYLFYLVDFCGLDELWDVIRAWARVEPALVLTHIRSLMPDPSVGESVDDEDADVVFGLLGECAVPASTDHTSEVAELVREWMEEGPSAFLQALSVGAAIVFQRPYEVLYAVSLVLQDVGWGVDSSPGVFDRILSIIDSLWENHPIEAVMVAADFARRFPRVKGALADARWQIGRRRSYLAGLSVSQTLVRWVHSGGMGQLDFALAVRERYGSMAGELRDPECVRRWSVLKFMDPFSIHASMMIYGRSKEFSTSHRLPLRTVSLELVLEACSSKSSLEREAAAYALGYASGDKAFTAMENLLEDSDSAVRYEAMQALRRRTG